MKTILSIVFALILLISTTNAQSTNKNVGITVKALVIDYQSQNNGEFAAFQKYHPGFELGLIKRINNQLYLHVPVKFAVVQDQSQLEALHRTLISADAVLHYQLIAKDGPIIPHLALGAGYVYEKNGTSNLQIPLGIGFNFRISDRSYLTWQSEFRYSLEDDRNNFHHGLGFTMFLGQRGESKAPDKKEAPIKEEMKKGQLDSDGDGIIDELDLCPQEAGPAEFDGCPDTDGDGIADYKDQCPEQFGAIALRGCPDGDGDGVADSEDECPNKAGSIANKGCPDDDADQDGVPNTQDKCPTVAGPATNNGCPEVDKDGDGTPDNLDRCPDQSGPKTTLGCPDQDNDGIPDIDDKCPSLAGSAVNGGCPQDAQDTDNDGVPDSIDKCPTKPGLSVYNGCPDTDGDGVDDSQDQCPNVKGTIANKGCPQDSTTPTTPAAADRDNDGVPDARDRCPDKAGPAVYDGCPDSDNDGIDDSRDRCPNSAGPVDTQGCPEIAPSDRRVLEIAMRSVQFESSKVEIKSESFNVLRQIADIMERYPDFNLIIEGHTDDQGDAAENQRLSEQRARACYNFLINSGVNSARMQYRGFGESKPIVSNLTAGGRTLNRRVEFALIPKN